MTLPMLLPALVTRLETIPALGSVTASANLINAQQLDHDQKINPKALAFLAELRADHAPPMLNAHQMQLTWTFSILLSVFAPHRFGQDQLSTLEQSQLAIIETLSGFQLHPQVTPLIFVKSQHHHPASSTNAPSSAYSRGERLDISHSGHWQTIMNFQTQRHLAIPTQSRAVQ